MVKELEVQLDLPGCSVSTFCELFKRADTVVGCHKDTYNNDHIRVSPWDGPKRRVAFLAPFSAPTWVKRTIGHEQVKVVEQQHLETEQDEGGGLRSMTMTSQPHLWVPGMGNVQIGDVRFHVYSSNDGSSCKIVTKLKCSAERFKWLWAIQGALEKIMLRECKHVAETFVAYCSRLVHEGAAVGSGNLPDQAPMRPDQEAAPADSLMRHSTRSSDSGAPTDAAWGSGGALSSRRMSSMGRASAGSTDGGGGNVAAGGLSRASAGSAQSGSEAYFDAAESLEDEKPCSGRPAEELPVLLRQPNSFHATMMAMDERLRRMEGDMRAIRAAVGERSSKIDWEAIGLGAAAGAAVSCSVCMLLWRLRRSS